MRILVTGATGTVGSQVVSFLAEKPNIQVRVGAHHPEKAQGMRDGNIEIVHFDFMQVDTMERAMEDVDKVFLLTPGAMEGYEMAMRAIEVMLGLPIRQVVRLSIFNAEMEPGIAITRDHRAVELALIENGLPYTFLRPSTYMDNLLVMADGIRRDEALYLPLGDSRISFIAPRDIGAVAATVLTSDGHLGKVYELTGPEALSGEDLARAIGDAIGKTIRYMPTSNEQVRQALHGKMPDAYLERVIEQNHAYQEGKYSRVTHTVQALTGHCTTFQDWLRLHAPAFRTREEKAA